MRCKFGDCEEEAHFRESRAGKARFCLEHSNDTMYKVGQRCIFKDCSNPAQFKHKGKKHFLYCLEHKDLLPEGSLMVGSRDTCVSEGCIREAHYGGGDALRPSHCSDHKTEGMINLSTTKCATPGCFKLAVYLYKGKKIFCREHRVEGMKSPVNCLTPGCDRSRIYNHPGQKAAYCAEHKEESMINVITKQCVVEGCLSGARYGREGEHALFCSKHKEDSMIDLKARRCKYEGCMLCPSFNYEGAKTGVYCSNHKSPEMVNVKK